MLLLLRIFQSWLANYKLSLFFICLSLLLFPTEASAWKPTTHVYFGKQALDDALDDGRVTISRVDYESGQIIEEIGTYAVDSDTLSALRTAAPQYRAGILGPDAYPDMLTGQQVIHPSSAETGIAGGSDAWLSYLWDRASTTNTPEVRAFTVGYLTHAAGDVYGHTFVNNFSGGSFAIAPPHGPANAVKHIVVEGYVDKRVDKRAMDADFFNVSIGGVEDFIYKNMIDASPGTVLDQELLRAGGSGTDFSVPRIFSSLRASLQQDIDDYYATKADYDRRADDCAPLDFSCSKTFILAEKAAYVAANGIQTTYKEAWRGDIESGLQAWPAVSHEVAKALFFNPSRSSDTQRAEAVLQDYSFNHLLSMAGAPDFVGLTAGTVNGIIEAITPDFLIEPIRQMKEDMLNAMLESAIGMDKQELKNYLTNPEQYFDSVIGSGAGESVTLQDFNSQYLKISDTGYNNPNEHFDPNLVPAAYNTIVMSKLALLSQGEVNRLLSDLGSTATLDRPNIMLGFVDTLDGDNQWQNGMALAKDCNAYRQVFMKQAGDGSACSKAVSSFPQTYLQSPVLDADYYLLTYGDLREAYGLSNAEGAKQHWSTAGLNEARRSSPALEVRYYRDIHPDLTKTFGDDYYGLVDHWLRHGIQEGRRSSLAFDVKYYLERYPDLQQAFGKENYPAALQHWLDLGIAEGRQGSADFDPKFYLENNPDVAKVYGADNYKGAIAHYLEFGKAEGRQATP